MTPPAPSRRVVPAAFLRRAGYELERLLRSGPMTPCEHCPAPGTAYTLRYLSTGERATREHQRTLCKWHAEQYQMLQERWSGVLLSIEPAF